MKVVTLRNLPPELVRRIRRKAREKHLSINKTVIGLLGENMGMTRKKKDQALHHDLDSLAGSWTKEEASAFDQALTRQRSIDPELWK
ncbi:MAG: hypothetical protein HY652_10140 [Acidobacteria bacterium]|nr:hypothetical protein [Acidobacteriota bacterium]